MVWIRKMSAGTGIYGRAHVQFSADPPVLPCTQADVNRYKYFLLLIAPYRR
jgi:hypothetical protein